MQNLTVKKVEKDEQQRKKTLTNTRIALVTAVIFLLFAAG